MGLSANSTVPQLFQATVSICDSVADLFNLVD